MFGSGFNSGGNTGQGAGFGGFGGGSNTGGGFGTPGNTGFGGGNTPGGGLFGNTSSEFGSGGGFGTNTTNTQSNLFGAKPSGFGTATTTAGTSIFGTSTSTAGASNTFGGFGASNTNATPAFGSGTTGGNLFGGNKTAFGGTPGTGSNLFGGGTSNAFGANTTNSAFPASTALGGAVEQSTGTGSTPFQAFQEKEPTTNSTNHFQSISFMQPYSKFAFEELRLADYNQGRRFGNSNNQAGAFGANTGFGGFGSTGTGTGLFGNATNTTAPFGGTGTNTFGPGNQTGGLFGQKPAGGSLFGNTTSTPQQGGGLFGTNNTGTGFGNTGTTGGFGTNTSGGGIFGATNQNQNAAKPFSFSNTGTGTGTGFGTTSNTSGFGNTQTNTGGLFGGTAQNNPPFGGTQQPATTNPFGGFGAQNQNTQGQNTGGFGNFGNAAAANKSLFGATTGTNTGTGLFGNTANQPQTGTGLFGNTTNTQTPNLFGNNQQNQAKPGLFGAQNAQQPAGTSIFGNNQGQSALGGGLFGAQQSQTKPPGLFGGLGGTNTQQPSGNSLFGGLGGASNTLNTGSSTFGQTNQNQQQGSSLFGTPLQNQQQTPQPLTLTASINDPSAYGPNDLFRGFGTPNAQSVGPLATPLSSSQKLRKNAILPQYKINPSASSRLVTPQKHGYGFSYSRYGTPSSISSSASTPAGLNSSLLGGSIGRSLGKSLSTSNLRRTFDSDDSVLAPGAFSASGSRSGTGSLKKLVINRSIRGDLFAAPENVNALPPAEKNDQSDKQRSILKKRVSFEAGTAGGNPNGNIFGQAAANGGHPLKQVENSRATPSAEEMGFVRPSARKDKNNSTTMNGSPHPEMEQVKGNELAIVHEDGSPTPNTSGPKAANGIVSRADPVPGAYWTKPSIDELKSMARERLKKVQKFTVGREGCGLVVFDVPADLTSIDLDKICGGIVVVAIRSCTVYPDNTTKPAPGYGLNLPSTITLYNSWPRAKDRVTPIYETSGPRYNKHVERLLRVADTKFKSYDKDNGTWVFSVDHYTTYTIEYGDDDDTTEGFSESNLSALHETPTPKSGTPNAQDVSMRGTESPEDYSSSDVDDTFDFKRSKKNLPGGFHDQVVYEDEGMVDEQDYDDEDQSFLDERSVESTSDDIVDEPSEVDDVDVNNAEDESVMIEDQDMAAPFPDHDDTTELQEEEGSPLVGNKGKTSALPGPKSILKPSIHRHDHNFGSPLARNQGSAFSPYIFSRQDDWTEQLQQTVSPKKQDRQALRESQGNVLKETERDGDTTPKLKRTASLAASGHGIATSIDLMNSLFGKEQGGKGPGTGGTGGKGKGFEVFAGRTRPDVAPAHWPYAKKSKTYDLDNSSMHPMDRESHEYFKPSWGPDGTLICALTGNATTSAKRNSQRENGILIHRMGSFAYEGKDLAFAKFIFSGINIPKPLSHQLDNLTDVYVTQNGIPMARTRGDFTFQTFFELVLPNTPRGPVERNIWKLAAILWDDLDRASGELTALAGKENTKMRAYIEDRLRKDNLTELWKKLVSGAATRQAQATESREEAAVAYLSMNDVTDACSLLIETGNYRLATLVSLIGGDSLMRKDIEEQLTAWRRLKALSEMTDPIRALYELVAGNPCLSEGVKGPLEDRTKSFIIPRRFGMDWRQTFGLYLWYAILEEQPLEDAVKLYGRDLENHKGEIARPLPWFVEQGMSTLWEDKHRDERLDLLWALLEFYADSKTAESEDKRRIPLDDILLPHNQELSPLDFRFSWQLQTLFAARGIGSLSPEKADQLTLDYAWQLETLGEWPHALIVLLHLSDPDRVSSAGRALISRHAAEFGNPEDDSYRLLVENFKVPEVWIWEARALYARSVEHNHVAELEFLLKAKNWEEAHATLCRFVAPMVVVEGNPSLLRRLLGGFSELDRVPNWMFGGQVYLDYINLLRETEEDELQFGRGSKPNSAGAEQEPRKGLSMDNSTDAIIRRLMGALPQMLRDERPEGFNLARVAVQEMSAVVGQYVLKRKYTANHDAARILQLPLTEDLCLKNTTEMSLRYYKALMLTTPSVSTRARDR
ncbi:MAG: Nuclear pore complex protein Nup98-Nup96 [Geoglossum umbratile]|nr:MAG: Nuclear pore complex protein Nup98-Nup96 [Geoglossum umbratile]